MKNLRWERNTNWKNTIKAPKKSVWKIERLIWKEKVEKVELSNFMGQLLSWTLPPHMNQNIGKKRTKEKTEKNIFEREKRKKNRKNMFENEERTKEKIEKLIWRRKECKNRKDMNVGEERTNAKTEKKCLKKKERSKF